MKIFVVQMKCGTNFISYASFIVSSTTYLRRKPFIILSFVTINDVRKFAYIIQNQFQKNIHISIYTWRVCSKALISGTACSNWQQWTTTTNRQYVVRRCKRSNIKISRIPIFLITPCILYILFTYISLIVIMNQTKYICGHLKLEHELRLFTIVEMVDLHFLCIIYHFLFHLLSLSQGSDISWGVAFALQVSMSGGSQLSPLPSLHTT